MTDKRSMKVVLIALLALLVPIAVQAQTDVVFYYVTDNIGSVRIVTDANGTIVGQYDFAPFGQNWDPTSVSDPRQFADSERGSPQQDNLDYFIARYYQGRYGRFISADDTAFMDPANPQSMNRYAYALNNPFRYIDPTGHRSDSVACPSESGYCEVVTVTAPKHDLDIGLFRFLLTSLFGDPMQLQGSGSLQQNVVPSMSVCSGLARVLKGNAATIGRPGGFSGPSVGSIRVTAAGAAIVPRQWASSRAALRPYLSQISGIFPSVGGSFQGVVDIVGGEPPHGFPPGTNVQDALMSKFPGKLILELPGASQDLGVTAVTLSVPSVIGCPAGTGGR